MCFLTADGTDVNKVAFCLQTLNIEIALTI